MGVNSLPKTVTRQRRNCGLNPGPSAPESSTLTTRLPSHPKHGYSSWSSSHTGTGTHMPHGITQCYLPPGRADISAITPAEAGTRLSDRGGMQCSVDLVGWLHTEMIYPPEDGHPSQY